MSIRRRVFLGMFFVFGIGLYFLLSWIIDDLTPQYRESTEEPLVDAARTLASAASATATDAGIDTALFRRIFDDAISKKFSAQIYKLEKTGVDWRVYITDSKGIIVFDSRGAAEVGKDYSRWRDVRMTLAGEYGARTSHEIPGSGESILYVAAPIMRGDALIGVLSVGKPSKNANQFIQEAKNKIAFGGVLCVLCMLATALAVSAHLTKPVQLLTTYARAIRDGRRAKLPKLAGAELKELGNAFEEMRDALEGKQYVENYVQTLTHEIKSPIAAIRGAAELLQENPPEERRTQFLQNIKIETERVQQLVDKLLLLSSLENRKGLAELKKLNIADLVTVVENEFDSVRESKHITCGRSLDPATDFEGDGFLVRHAISNLLQNALEFTPRGGSVSVTVRGTADAVELEIVDSGPGIPEYATTRVFERFYSLKRPDTGKKSSGLGLSLVQEVAAIHGGSIKLENRAEVPGARALFVLPRLR